VSARLIQQAFLINIDNRGDGNINPTDPPPGEFHGILKVFQDLFGEPTYSHSQKGTLANFENKTELDGKIPFRSPYRISPREEEELRKQIATQFVAVGFSSPGAIAAHLNYLYISLKARCSCVSSIT
jgi:hypothetical protein